MSRCHQMRSTCRDLAEALQAGLRAVSRQTKARPGDKTMMDALVPADGRGQRSPRLPARPSPTRSKKAAHRRGARRGQQPLI